MDQTKTTKRILGDYHYPTWARVMECLGIAGYLLMFGSMSLATARTTQAMWRGDVEASAYSWVALPLAALLAYIMADFVSGFVHCCADNFGHEDTFFFGPAFIKPFREHHRDPEGITHHDFIEVNGNSCLVNLLVMVPAYFALPWATNAWSAVGGSFFIAFTLSIVFTNQFHKWAHQKSRSRFATTMQKVRFVLTPEIHAIHHTPPFERYYCITSGWLNPLLERAGFFDWLTKTFEWAKPENLPRDVRKKAS